MFKNDILHTLIEDQIWSFPLVRLALSLTNQVKMNRGVGSIQSLRESLAWLKLGHSLVVAPEGERTSVIETREATRGIVWLAAKAKVPLVPVGVWISEEDLYTKKVRYHFQNRSYTVESFSPAFEGGIFCLSERKFEWTNIMAKDCLPRTGRRSLTECWIQSIS
jgi:hypothetical protein